MSIEWFNVVDQSGKIIGKEKREKCHNGCKILHSVVHVHIINSKNQLLLQKRSMDKDIQPGKWDTSVGGHIKAGETVYDAVKRESLEEEGIIIDLGKLFKLKEYIFESDIEIEYIYSYIFFYDGKIVFQKEEIDDVRFFNLNDIIPMIKNNQITFNFIKEFDFLQKIDFNELRSKIIK